MSLLRNVGTIGGLTLVSRFAGLAREMIFSRVLGANAVTDAWFQAFIIPNVFRRMFAEGAFSAAFVPMFSKRLHGDGGIEEARSFSNDVLSVFLPVLIAVCAVMMLAMPLVIRLLGDGDSSPANFAMEVDFARIMFPYIALVSMVTLFTGMLNSVSRFAPGASFPIILNLVLIANLLIGDHAISQWGWTTRQVGYTQAWAVTVGGAIQLAWLYYWTRVEGFRPKLLWPRITPEVKRLSIIAFPAAIGGGAYQINTLVQLYFLNQLDSGSISYADRLNQLPLGIIGIALSTAILPTLSKFVGAKNRAGTDRIQSDAIELAMLLTIPAAVALAICAEPFVTMIFQGGRFSLEQAALTGNVLAALVLGLPAYVLVKVQLLRPVRHAHTGLRGVHLAGRVRGDERRDDRPVRRGRGRLCQRGRRVDQCRLPLCRAGPARLLPHSVEAGRADRAPAGGRRGDGRCPVVHPRPADRVVRCGPVRAGWRARRARRLRGRSLFRDRLCDRRDRPPAHHHADPQDPRAGERRACDRRTARSCPLAGLCYAPPR